MTDELVGQCQGCQHPLADHKRERQLDGRAGCVRAIGLSRCPCERGPLERNRTMTEQVELWNALLDAMRAVQKHTMLAGDEADRLERVSRLQYRNGLLDAYSLVTDKDSETVYLDMQDALQDEYERNA